ncbi:hypothetical protein NTGZN8_60001 [Candidatus Nitrotoga fabula]|uniref:Uncharacterized protein n=1 Tax=Candidatus Nitrotoga fabula TaxID=2182327 RepID=A0A916BHL1_9PROT|nr:hypothetical protein NTGZN8_60001 [Candidatus Nitrotoga fabula]
MPGINIKASYAKRKRREGSRPPGSHKFLYVLRPVRVNPATQVKVNIPLLRRGAAKRGW